MTDLIQIPKTQLQRNAAFFDEDMSLKEWGDAGRVLCEANQASQWWVGDWVNFGERSYQRNKEALAWFGKEILGEENGYAIHTIQQYSWVCRKVKPSNRLEGLSFSHHIEVATQLEADQLKWLARAKQGDEGKTWTVAQLRQAIRAEGKQVETADVDPAPTVTKYMTEAVCWLGREDKKLPIEKWDRERCELVILSLNKIEPFRKRLGDRISALR